MDIRRVESPESRVQSFLTEGNGLNVGTPLSTLSRPPLRLSTLDRRLRTLP